MTPTERWAAELRRTLKERGWTANELARQMGIASSGAYSAVSGRKVPTYARAIAIADALMAPRLAELAREMRTGTCDICGASFVDNGKNLIRRHCSTQCTHTAAGRRYRVVRRQEVRQQQLTLRVASARLTKHQKAVAAFCRRCSGESCQDAECELRPCSPLPLIVIEPRRAA